VIVALLVIVSQIIKSSRHPDDVPHPGLALVTETGDKWPALSTTGRGRGKRGFALISEGHDTLRVNAYGRQAGARRRHPHVSGRLGRRPRRLRHGLRRQRHGGRANVEVAASTSGPFTALRRFLIGPPPEPRAALMLRGAPGRYVALVVPGNPGHAQLDKMLGSGRDNLVIGDEYRRGTYKLEFRIDPRKNELTGYVDGRQIADPIDLDGGLRKLFNDDNPQVAVGCLDGACTFHSVEVHELSAGSMTGGLDAGRLDDPIDHAHRRGRQVVQPVITKVNNAIRPPRRNQHSTKEHQNEHQRW